MAGQDPGESEAAVPIEAYPVDMVIEAWRLMAARAGSDMQVLFYRGYNYSSDPHAHFIAQTLSYTVG